MRWLMVALFVVLAGCGGALPASQAGGPSAALRSVDASNRGVASGTLWVSSSYSAVAYSLAAGPPTGFPSLTIKGITNLQPSAGETGLIQDMTVAPDGTVYELVVVCPTATCADDAAYRWKLKLYAPGTYGAAPVEQRITGTGRGRSVALDNNSIDVLSSDGTAAAPHGYVASYGYASGNDPAPVRTLTLAYAPRYFALDVEGLMYVGSGSSIFVYPVHSRGAAPCPVRTISLPGVLDDAFALGPGRGIYVPIHPYSGPATVIYAYGQRNNGPAPNGSIQVQGGRSAGIAVDANQNVYVGMGYNAARVYSLATGNTVLGYIPMPQWDPTNPEQPYDGYVLAIGPPPVTASH